jgi:2-haloacid dehalogenase
MNFTDVEVLTFDCYGTLVDWESGILAALQPVLAAHGAVVDDEPLLELYGKLEAKEESGDYLNYKTVLQNVLQRLGEQLNFKPSQEELEGFAFSVKDWQPFPDTVSALKALKRRYQLGIISNIDDDLFAFPGPRLGVEFDWLITAEQVQSYKPSFNNFQQALARIGKPQEKILHVAQSIFHDIIPAKQLGLSTVWVNRRHNKEGAGATKAAEGQADLAVNDLISLVQVFDIGQKGQ